VLGPVSGRTVGGFPVEPASPAPPEQLGNLIPNGASLALAPDYSGWALSVIRALIRRSGRTST
jgi:hypothetical protein